MSKTAAFQTRKIAFFDLHAFFVKRHVPGRQIIAKPTSEKYLYKDIQQ